MAWNPEQYLAFAGHRLRPAIDLIQRIPLQLPDRVVDLGCGTGNVTKLLRERWPSAQITGIDNSPEMLAKAASEGDGIQWQQSDLSDWHAAQPVDLIFSNAALHWVDGHESLFTKLLGLLEQGGIVAVQMPRNFAAPSHRAIIETVMGGPWREKLLPRVRTEPVQSPETYYQILAPHCRQIDVWETEYLQVLTGANPVAEWVKGTWLTRFMSLLNSAEAQAFEADYAKRVATAYPAKSDGKTLFPFRRLFIVALK